MRRLLFVVFLVLLTNQVSASLAEEETQASPIDLLAAPPNWQAGEWWNIQLVGARAADEYETVVVVAKVEPGRYLIGMPPALFDPAFLSYHLPGIGFVNRTDLSFEVHKSIFEPIRFPARTGTEWKTSFADIPLNAQIMAADDTTAEIWFRLINHDDPFIRATYDADLRYFSTIDIKGYGVLTTTDHGFGYRCSVQAPTEVDFLFLGQPGYSMAGLTLGGASIPKGFEVARSYDATAVFVIAGANRGATAVALIDPAGRHHEAVVGPQDDKRVQVRSVSTGDPKGSWKLEGVVDDGGFALAEALGYSVRDVVPDAERPPAGSVAAPGCHARWSDAEPGAKPMLVGRGENIDRSGVLLWTATGAIALAGLLIRSKNWRRLLLLPLAPLFAKLSPQRVTGHPTRHDILELVRTNPAITTQEIRHALGLPWGTIVHHVLILERHGLLVAEQWGRNRDWFLAAEWTPRARLERSALKRDAARVLFERIQKSPGVGQQELARDLGVHHSTVHFHIQRLEKAHLIECKRAGARTRYFPTVRPIQPALAV